jgi:hypothetical protein
MAHCPRARCCCSLTSVKRAMRRLSSPPPHFGCSGPTPDFVVMMIGLADRQTIGERQIRNAAQQRVPGQPSQTPSSAVVEVEQAKAPDDASTRTNYDFRSDQWGRFYGKRIDDTISALKSRGVPVLGWAAGNPWKEVDCRYSVGRRAEPPAPACCRRSPAPMASAR